MQNERQKELISVIVPVFKVEQYLDKCVESILRQSYSNLELILVDDGSPDNCGKMCDSWAEIDSRIRVIHKKNGGLSDARNVGLDLALGDYFAFVDSDDFIHHEMLERLYVALKTNDADMSIGSCVFVDETGIPLESDNHDRVLQNMVVPSVVIINHLPEEKGGKYIPVWNKLYKKSLFENIRFPKGKLCEDAFLMHYLLEKCRNVVCISNICYYYRVRPGSIYSSKSGKLYLNEAEAYLDLAIYSGDRKIHPCAEKAYWRAAMLITKVYYDNELGPDLLRELKTTIALYRKNFSLHKNCSPKKKLQLFLIFLSPSLYHSFFHNPLRKRLMLAKR